MISMLKDLNLDVVIAIVGEKEKSLDYQMVSLCENVMAVGYGHPLRQKARTKDGFRYPWIPLELCSSEPNVMLMPGSSYRRFADSLYASYGLTPNVAYQFEATRTGLVCVAHNGAVMLTNDHMISNSFQEDLVVPLSVGETPTYRELCVITSRYSQMNVETDTLSRLVKECLG